MRPNAALAFAIAASAGCGDREAPPRPQVLVVIDTDAPVLDQARGDPTISPVIAIDTVRIDLLDDADTVRVYREFTASSPLDWPLSFALVPSDIETKIARLRIRAFRAHDAFSDVVNGATALSPQQPLSLDRVVEVALPSSDVVDARRVFLPAACYGRVVSFRDRTSCAPDGVGREPFDVPLPVAARGSPSSVGTWNRAHQIPCPAPAPDGRVCVPGGISILGDDRVSRFTDGLVVQPSGPMRLVEIAPFYMDRTEVTLGRLRAWRDRLDPPPLSRSPKPTVEGFQFCTLANDAPDGLPVNCVSQETAAQFCALEGGALPTEAQWNHAATGRGDGRLFPWGDQDPDCCMLSAGRVSVVGTPAACKDASGVEPVGSHTGQGCTGPGDVSRDGVLDLGGSMRELLRDQEQVLDDPCWGDAAGILVDPTCTKRTGVSLGVRGAAWPNDPFQALNGLRNLLSLGITVGFRCVYPAGPAGTKP